MCAELTGEKERKKREEEIERSNRTERTTVHSLPVDFVGLYVGPITCTQVPR